MLEIRIILSQAARKVDPFSQFHGKRDKRADPAIGFSLLPRAGSLPPGLPVKPRQLGAVLRSVFLENLPEPLPAFKDPRRLPRLPPFSYSRIKPHRLRLTD